MQYMPHDSTSAWQISSHTSYINEYNCVSAATNAEDEITEGFVCSGGSGDVGLTPLRVRDHGPSRGTLWTDKFGLKLETATFGTVSVVRITGIAYDGVTDVDDLDFPLRHFLTPSIMKIEGMK